MSISLHCLDRAVVTGFSAKHIQVDLTIADQSVNRVSLTLMKGVDMRKALRSGLERHSQSQLSEADLGKRVSVLADAVYAVLSAESLNLVWARNARDDKIANNWLWMWVDVIASYFGGGTSGMNATIAMFEDIEGLCLAVKKSPYLP